MTLRVLNAQGAVTRGTLHVLNAKGSVVAPSATGTLRILNAKGTVSNVVIGTLRVLNAKGSISLTAPGRLRVLNAKGSVLQLGIALAPFTPRSVKSMSVVSINPQPAPGTPTPDSYTYALIPNSDVHTLQINADGTFRAPGRLNGCTVNIAVTAHQGATASSPQTAQFIVGRHNDFMRIAGVWTAVHIVDVLHK